MKIVELKIDENAELFGIEAISLVERPAIQANFIALAEEGVTTSEMWMMASQERQVVMGPAMIPDKPIKRVQDGEEFYVYFSKDTVRQASELFLKNSRQGNSTLEHQYQLSGNYVVESWIVEGSDDKSQKYGMDMPVGTWMVSMKIPNRKVWDSYVANGQVKGFSIEGFFSNYSEAQQDANNGPRLQQIDLLDEIERLCKETATSGVKTPN